MSSKDIQTTTSPIPTRRRGNIPPYFNFLVSILLFLLLIQFFDPYTASTYHSELVSLRHHDNPVIQSISHQRHHEQNVLWKGREKLYNMLQEAGLASSLTLTNISTLPMQDTIDQHYGQSAVIVGMDECESYRSSVPFQERQLGVAGMFNTGTNLLDNQLRKNVKLAKSNLWQVPWGKHRMAVSKWNHTAHDMDKYNKTAVLPVVVIRHPLAWLSSMCSHPYAALWHHGKTTRCPNLVVTDEDRRQGFSSSSESFRVTVKFDEQNREHFDSLVHLWSQWYRQYYEAPYPILMVRFEDLVFAPALVLKEITKCVGGHLAGDGNTIQYQTKTSKAHGSGTDLLAAIRKTANLPRLSHPADVSYAEQHLDPELMRVFRYRVEAGDTTSS